MSSPLFLFRKVDIHVLFAGDHFRYYPDTLVRDTAPLVLGRGHTRFHSDSREKESFTFDKNKTVVADYLNHTFWTCEIHLNTH